MKLIALVTVLATVEGKRVEIAPGEPVPELPAHDVEQLLAMNAIEDADAKAAQVKADAKAEREGLKEFEAAREAVQAQAQSIAPAQPQEPSPPAGGKAAAKKAAG